MFNTFRQVYEENPKVPAKKVLEPVVELNKDGEPKEPLHDKAFKPSNPSRKGVIKGTLERFPAYLPNPPVELKRKVLAEGEEEESIPGFKATYRNKTRPTPSVATNFRNLKASYPAAFAR